MDTKSIYDVLEKEIMGLEIPKEEKDNQISKLLKAKEEKINIMLVGVTGSGKSSTINSIFDTKTAKVGIGVEPETKDIECYQLENLTIWDTPGLGDIIENDRQYSEMIAEKLLEVDEDGVPVIDLVIVVIDGSTRDMSAVYDMISNTLIPTIQDKNRILIAVNQADMAMKGNHWDAENNCPDEILKKFLEEKCASIKQRIMESTNVEFEPVYYCAGYTNEDDIQHKPYNLTKLLYHIVLSLPASKRITIAENLNTNQDMWENDDEEMDYTDEVANSFGAVFADTVEEFAENGAMAGGMVLGVPGMIVGGILGGVAGAVTGFFKGVFEL